MPRTDGVGAIHILTEARHTLAAALEQLLEVLLILIAVANERIA